MPQIIVIADSLAEDGTARVMLRERVTERDFESGHFAAQLAQRLGWAVGDAPARRPPFPTTRRRSRSRSR
jgi:hypothetical protein